MKLFGSKKFKIHAFWQKLADWLDMPSCPDSAALFLQEKKIENVLFLINYELKTSSVHIDYLLGTQNEIQAVCYLILLQT